MKCVIPQIFWNSGQQVLSLDFDPSCKGEDGFYRLVTVGADTNVLIWHLSNAETSKPILKCACELNRHQKAVNVARFSPDGNFLASGDDDAYIIIWRNERKSPEEENWTVEKSLRKHLGDITDLSWSPDGNYLLSSSVDNSAVCWDVKKGVSRFLWTDHNGFVQGVSLDPNGEVAATISNDRVLRIFDLRTGKPKYRVNKYSGWVEKNDVEDSLDLNNTLTTGDEATGDEGEKTKKTPLTMGNHIFLGDDVATFCRRLSFSPRGELLLVPTGSLPMDNKTNMSDQCESLGSDPANMKLRPKPLEKPQENNAAIMFCRNDFSVPCAIIPTGPSYSVACRFNPAYFRKQGNTFHYGEDIVNPVKVDERRIYCTGKLENSEDDVNILDAPYRIVYAIATNNTVMIGATDKVDPLAVVRNIHMTRLTDLSWSPDGKLLVTSSTDAYCSIISFAQNELGLPFQDPILPLNPSDFPVPIRKNKENKSKTNSVKKDKPATASAKRKAGETKEKTPSSKPKKNKGSKSSKSASCTPVRLTGEKMRIKPVKIHLEAQGTSGRDTGIQEEDLIPLDESPQPAETQNNLPNPYVYLVRLPDSELKSVSTAIEETEESAKKSPPPIKFIPQKNTLDSWIVKKKAEKRERSSTPEVQVLSPAKNECSVGINGSAESGRDAVNNEQQPEQLGEETTLSASSVVQSSVSCSSSGTVVGSPQQKQPRRIALITLSTSTSVPQHSFDASSSVTNLKQENE